jgi:hypothetical protein
VVGLLALCAAGLAVFIWRGKNLSLPVSFGINEAIGLLSLLLNAALFLITIISLAIAVAAYQASEKGGAEQLQTLNASRDALEKTSGTLQQSALDFKTSAEAASGQYKLLQQERQERDEAVLSALKREININLAAISVNQKMLMEELKILNERRSVVTPLQTVETDAWNLLKLYIPAKLTHDGSTLSLLIDVYALLMRVSEMMVSREGYRLANDANTGFSRRMQIYDEDLSKVNDQVKLKMESLIKTLSSVH